MTRYQCALVPLTVKLAPSTLTPYQGRNSEMRTIRLAPPTACSTRPSRRRSRRNAPEGELWPGTYGPEGAPAPGAYGPAGAPGGPGMPHGRGAPAVPAAEPGGMTGCPREFREPIPGARRPSGVPQLPQNAELLSF